MLLSTSFTEQLNPQIQNTQNMPSTESTTQAILFYFGDPMCSWCYGFSPELDQALETLGESVEFKMVMGGLRPYGTETMKDLSSFLEEHWQHVNEASGQPFSYEILKDATFVYDTEPASRAVLVARKLKPEIEFEFFHAIQTAFYAENKNTHQVETYLELAERFGMSKKAFKTAFESEEMKLDTRTEFAYAAEMGIRGFPTMILKNGEKYTMITNGYQKAEKIVEAVQKNL